MPIIDSLIGNGFLSKYTYVAGQLADTYGLVPDPNMFGLETIHDEWRSKLNQWHGTLQVSTQKKPSYDEYKEWAHFALQELVVALCACEDCVSYTVFDNYKSEVGSNTFLMLKYPSVYTALIFIRHQYMGILVNQNQPTLERMPRVASQSHTRIHSVLDEVQSNPRLAENFVNIFDLPPL